MFFLQKHSVEAVRWFLRRGKSLGSGSTADDTRRASSQQLRFARLLFARESVSEDQQLPQ